MKKKTLIAACATTLLVMAIAGVAGYRLYHKPHRSAAAENAIDISAAQLSGEFERDEAIANKKYLGRAVQVTGTVSDISTNQENKPVLVLTGDDMGGVQCTLLNGDNTIKKGDLVTIKGFCSGFLTDVIINSCIVVKR